MREKSQVLSEFWIKILAILTMTLDHIGAFIVDSDWTVNFPTNGVAYGVGYVFRCVGRLSFPLFAFMLAEGMRKSHEQKISLFCRDIFISKGVLQNFSPPLRSFKNRPRGRLE